MFAIAAWLSAIAYLPAAEPLPVSMLEELAQLARKTAMNSPKAVTGSLESARQEALEKLNRLEAMLAGSGGGAAWRTYVKTDKLREILQPVDTLNVADVDAGVERLRCALAVWPNAELEAVRTSLARYSTHAYRPPLPDYENQRQAKLAELVALLPQCDSLAPDEPLEQIANIATWFRHRDDAIELVEKLEAHFRQPNIVARFSERAITGGRALPVDEAFSINRVYIGTLMRGAGRIVGLVKQRLVRTDNRAGFDLSLEAHTTAHTVGYNSGASITSDSRTTIRGSKRIWFESAGLRSEPAQVSATAQVQLRGDSLRRGRIAAAIAARRVQANQPQAEAEAIAEAEQSAKQRLDQVASESLAQINDAYRENLLYPLTGHYMWPQSVVSRVAEGQLLVEALLADAHRFQRIAPRPLADSCDGCLQMHARVLDQLGQSFLAGREFRGQEINDFLAGLTSAPPHAPETAGERQPPPSQNWAIEFDGNQPLEVTIDAGQLAFVLRLAGFASEGKSYPGVKVKILLRPVSGADGVILVRDEPVWVRPVDFIAGTSQRMTGPQQVMCKILARRLEGALPREMPLRSSNLFGKLSIATIDAQQGWLTVGMRLVEDSSPQAF